MHLPGTFWGLISSKLQKNEEKKEFLQKDLRNREKMKSLWLDLDNLSMVPRDSLGIMIDLLSAEML